MKAGELLNLISERYADFPVIIQLTETLLKQNNVSEYEVDEVKRALQLYEDAPSVVTAWLSLLTNAFLKDFKNKDDLAPSHRASVFLPEHPDDGFLVDEDFLAKEVTPKPTIFLLIVEFLPQCTNLLPLFHCCVDAGLFPKSYNMSRTVLRRITDNHPSIVQEWAFQTFFVGLDVEFIPLFSFSEKNQEFLFFEKKEYLQDILVETLDPSDIEATWLLVDFFVFHRENQQAWSQLKKLVFRASNCLEELRGLHDAYIDRKGEKTVDNQSQAEFAHKFLMRPRLNVENIQVNLHRFNGMKSKNAPDDCCFLLNLIGKEDFEQGDPIRLAMPIFRDGVGERRSYQESDLVAARELFRNYIYCVLNNFLSTRVDILIVFSICLLRVWIREDLAGANLQRKVIVDYLDENHDFDRDGVDSLLMEFFDFSPNVEGEF